MVKLDHLAITVRDHHASRDWYVDNLGLRVEFEVLTADGASGSLFGGSRRGVP